MNYRNSEENCGGCGSTYEERKTLKGRAKSGLNECPYCGSDKCSMCDMGDDVECGNCLRDDEGED